MRRRRSGFFLLIALIVITVATMAVYTFTETMVTLDDAAYLETDSAQADQCTLSAAAMLRVFLSQPIDARVAAGGTYNNPSMFQAVPISSEAGETYSFSIIDTNLQPDGRLGGIRYGLRDESSRLNVNALPILDRNSDAILPLMSALSGDVEGDIDALSAGDSGEVDQENLASSLLMAVPGMTPDLADAILDWIDEDDDPRPFGAETDDYAMLPTPYACTNGPITSVDELLLVQGMTPTLMFGADANRNGVLDADEQQRFGISVDTPGSLGMAAYLTAFGSEANVRGDGTAKVNVNNPDVEALYDQLQEVIENADDASFIAAYRVAGTRAPTMASAASMEAAVEEAANGSDDAGSDDEDSGIVEGGVWTADAIEQVDLTGGGQDISQLLDLIGATVTVSGADGKQIRYESPFSIDPVSMQSYLPIFNDTLTTTDIERLPGRLNVNTCPVELLYGIPMLDDETISAIVETRDPLSTDPIRRDATWLMAEGIVTIDQMRLLTPILCGGGSVYRGQVIGYRSGGGAFDRAEIIMDAHTVNPKIIGYRNLSHLGRGFDLSVLGSRFVATPQ